MDSHTNSSSDAKSAAADIKPGATSPGAQSQMSQADLVRLLRSDVNAWNDLRKNSPDLEIDLREVNLAKCNLEGANLSQVRFTEANLNRAKLKGADLRGARLRYANLADADLEGADLRNASFNSKTVLEGATVKGAKVLRTDLEQLSNYGGLTLTKLRQMDIHYDLGILRASFSGVMSFIHVAALLLFITPYVIFITAQIIKDNFYRAVYAQSDIISQTVTNRTEDLKARASSQVADLGLTPESAALVQRAVTSNIDSYREETIRQLELQKRSQKPLWEVLLNYIWENRWLFIFLAAYNVLRAILLWKTKRLEQLEEIQGFSSDFEFSKNRLFSVSYRAMNVMFFINLLLVVIHTYHFFNLKIYV